MAIGGTMLRCFPVRGGGRFAVPRQRPWRSCPGLAVLALVLLSAGCRGGTSSEAAAEPTRGGTLVVAVRTAPDSANPYVARSQASLELANRTLPRLFAEILPDTLEGRVELRPELVREWAFPTTG